MRTRNTSYQHDPLVIPSRWEEEEKRFALRLRDLIENLFKKIGGMKNQLYPIGSVYITQSDNNPQAWLGGIWEQAAITQEGFHYWLRTK